MLTKVANTHRMDWDEKLFFAIWAYWTTFKVSTRLTPFKLAFEQESITPLEFAVANCGADVTERIPHFLDESTREIG